MRAPNHPFQATPRSALPLFLAVWPGAPELFRSAAEATGLTA